MGEDGGDQNTKEWLCSTRRFVKREDKGQEERGKMNRDRVKSRQTKMEESLKKQNATSDV